MIKLKSIKSKLIIIFALLIVVSLVIVGGVSAMITSKNMKATVEKQATDMVRMTASIISTQIESVENYVIGLSSNGDLKDFLGDRDIEARNRVYSFLEESRNQKSEQVESLLLLDKDMMALVTNVDKYANIDLSQREYVQEAFKGLPSMSDVLVSKMTGNPIVAIAIPLRDGNSIEGVLVATINFSEIAKHVEAIKLGEHGYGYMINNEGVLISHPIKEKILVEDLSKTKVSELKVVVEKMIDKKDGVGSYTYEGITKIVAYYPVGPFSVAVTSAEEDYMSTAKSIVRMMIIIDSIVIVLASIVVALVSRRLSHNVIKIKDAAEQLADGNIDIDIDIKTNDEFEQLGNAFKKVATNLEALVTEAESITNDSIRGNLSHRGDEKAFNGQYKSLIKGMNEIMDSLVGHLDHITNPVTIMDQNYNVLYSNKAYQDMLDKTFDHLLGGKCHEQVCSLACENDNCPAKRAMLADETVNVETSIGEKEYIFTASPIKDRSGNIVAVLETMFDQTDIIVAQRESEKQAKAVEEQMQISVKQGLYQNQQVEALIGQLDLLAKGNLNLAFKEQEYDEDTKDIAQSFDKINTSLKESTSSIRKYIEEIDYVLSEMSNKNLETTIHSQFLGDFEQLKTSINHISAQFNIVLAEINASSEQVGAGAEQVAQSSQQLSQGASEQASSVEEISATVTEIGQQTSENADNARKANQITLTAMNHAEDGNSKMAGMLDAMAEIKESSRSIANIIKVIDEIAFQTNILALNAAVEAARAGEHGKGFAVVAEEVRNLAARSANAAKETTEMIDSSIQKVEEGSLIANDTAEAFGVIVNGVSEAGEMVGLIAEASSQQATAINQIEEGVNQISQVTQANSATAEQSAAASEEMSGQADELKQMINEFRLRKS